MKIIYVIYVRYKISAKNLILLQGKLVLEASVSASLVNKKHFQNFF